MSKQRQQGFKDRYSKDPRDPQREVKQAVDLGGTSGTTTTTATPTSSSAPAKITETSRVQRRIQQQKQSSGGVVIFRSYPFDAAATRRVIFNGKENEKLSDIIFCNTSRTDAITFELRITTLDIENIPQKDRTISAFNSSIDNSDSTAFLINQKELAAKGTTTLSAMTGGLLAGFAKSESRPYFIYAIVNQISSGALDITVIK